MYIQFSIPNRHIPIPLMTALLQMYTIASFKSPATRDRNTTAYEYKYKAMNFIKTNLFVHTIIMNTITKARGREGGINSICIAL